MGYCCDVCGDSEYVCTAWDGTGNFQVSKGIEMETNHNLVEKCPKDIKTCVYRKEKSKPF